MPHALTILWGLLGLEELPVMVGPSMLLMDCSVMPMLPRLVLVSFTRGVGGDQPAVETVSVLCPQ